MSLLCRTPDFRGAWAIVDRRRSRRPQCGAGLHETLFFPQIHSSPDTSHRAHFAPTGRRGTVTRAAGGLTPCAPALTPTRSSRARRRARTHNRPSRRPPR
jgi:hypothetical protein